MFSSAKSICDSSLNIFVNFFTKTTCYHGVCIGVWEGVWEERHKEKMVHWSGTGVKCLIIWNVEQNILASVNVSMVSESI